MRHRGRPEHLDDGRPERGAAASQAELVAPASLATGQCNPTFVAVDSTIVYWTNSGILKSAERAGFEADHTPDVATPSTQFREVTPSITPSKGADRVPMEGNLDHSLVQIEAPPQPAGDPVETALATALDRASAAGRYDVVIQLARELEARRTARSPNVVRLEDERAKRGT